MKLVDYYALDLVELAARLAIEVPGVSSVRLFGSRKYPGKVRSDLDLLVEGPSNLTDLVEFRDGSEHYQPLDLWLVSGSAATSAVNGSTLSLEALRPTIDLFPTASELPEDLRVQRFRSDITYAMTIVPPSSYVPVRSDPLGITTRTPKLLGGTPVVAAEALVDIIQRGLQALHRMRRDPHALRGSSRHQRIGNEYDLQNLVELLLAPIVALNREAFAAKCEGVKRTVDFALASGRMVLELKFSKTNSELGAAVKDAKGVLSCYLDHPGVEVALAVLGVPQSLDLNVNALESWIEQRGERVGLIRTVVVPDDLLLDVEG